ncbi:MAG: pyrroline-5-carboxylate reductase [Candidatus Lambdaproteobacteria bacterium RIFOXYD2_FULL_50_16]|uniref:Pyrroline-5-carboxylate reductase n=1 Tax=Candidatus Lambdaproteobacteria bacterium RIFOXYD2_FULL_50_16 TaxID=1817772 RepID=A0A1F6G6K2_9PROT|nr:MAG: pyrroline-5-carboxylate reductase [Candidatus Lambdaproteobacteria bacterium RIFOXYD2_FULL_50_16]
MKRALIVGCGNMGSAIATALLEKEIFSRESLEILERRDTKQTLELEGKGVKFHRELNEVQAPLELVVLAVKPQDAVQVMGGLAPMLNGDSLVISIMAGITLAKMESFFPNRMIVRAMPNTPSAIGQGMTAFCGNTKVTPGRLGVAQVILSGLGQAIEVESEQMIDAATAISGSGPAYLFYLAEAMAEAAVRFGFSRNNARTLVSQTLVGASLLLASTDEEAADLRVKVTSKGGTTEAALNHLNQAGVLEQMIQAFTKAKERAEELGRE